MREESVRRVLRALLALYPASFRERLGEDLLETVLHRWRARRGAHGGAAFWLGEGLRFGLDGLIERARTAPAVWADWQHAWRQVWRAPLQHALAVLTLAAGIAATSLMVTFADAVVFRPLPYPEPAALHLVHTRFGTLELSTNSLPNLHDLRGTLSTVVWLEGAATAAPALTAAGGDPERVHVLAVTERYLEGLGAEIRSGRAFSAEDYEAASERVALLGEGFVRRRWGGSAVIGQRIELDGVDHTVVGVVAAEFRDPEPLEGGGPTAVWVPARADDGLYRHRDAYRFGVLARVSAAASAGAVRSELAAAGGRLSASYPETNRVGGDAMELVPYALHEQTVGDARARLLVLLGAVTLLLLLACANAASLFLARGLARTSELAVRAALGASQARLARQLFAENVVTALLAGLSGGAAAVIGLRVLLAVAPAGIPRLHTVAVDTRALLAVLGVTVVTAVIFGSLPALRGARAAVASAGARLTATRGTHRLQSLLVGAEVAIAFVLVTGSALLLGSLHNMLTAEPGFRAESVQVADVRAPAEANSHALEIAFHDRLLDAVGALPGVRRAALLHSPPGVAPGAWSQVSLPGQEPRTAADRPRASALGASPGSDFVRLNVMHGDVFAVLGMRLLAGAGVQGRPGRGDPLVVVINEAAARRFFPDGAEPLGQHIMLGPPGSTAPPREIVGIVNDVRQRGPGADFEPQIYVPFTQGDIDRLSLLIEHDGAAPGVADLTRMLHDVAPGVPLDGAGSLAAHYDSAADLNRFLTWLLSVFAAAGLLLALVGTYATTAQASARRARELSIRVALGARADEIVRLVLGRAVRTVAVGIAAGLLAALVLTRALRGYLVGVSTHEPATLLAVAALVCAAVVLAATAPALRAARVQPNDVLKGT